MKTYIVLQYWNSKEIDFDIINTDIEEGTDEWETLIEGYEDNDNMVIPIELNNKNLKKIENIPRSIAIIMDDNFRRRY